MKRIFKLQSFLFVAFLATTAQAADEPPIPKEDYVFCTVCHGIQMGGNEVIEAPRLSGVETWYIERQLQSFKNGWRGSNDEDHFGHEMRPMAAVLTDREIAEVSAFVNATQSAKPEVTIDGDATRGKALYASCMACHGANGEGNELLAAPSLVEMNDWYLLTQMKNFKSGVRGSAAGDTYGQQMKAAAQLLPDEQAMRDVVRYIASMNEQ